MKRQSILIASLSIALLVWLAGCSTGGMFTAANITSVQLQKNNYRIVARGVLGQARAGYLLGGTVSQGITTSTAAVARVSGTGMLYKEALDDLWKTYESTYGPVGNKTVALTNVHFDSDALNLLIYTEARIYVRADVVEFTE